eukprot:gb/GECG01011475.1/.p1 GENE.gb/GECG01011475.1/~~gb/GECG01011475.1/.p1  ORF type:complete len:273 (+),score=20.32 gb/GECG01011475.1/:1-819(+)
MHSVHTLRIGVLALQGAVQEHVSRFRSIKCQDPCKDESVQIESFPVKNERTLKACDALVIPGGESTTMALVAKNVDMWEPLKDFMDSGKPVWGTCAGLILCAHQLTNPVQGQETLDVVDLTVTRNYFGRQIASAEKTIKVDTKVECVKETLEFADKCSWAIGPLEKGNSIAERSLPVYGRGTTRDTENLITQKLSSSTGVFIRAPIISKTGSQCEIFASVVDSDGMEVNVGCQHAFSRLFTAFHPELTENYGWHQYFVAMVLRHYAATEVHG